MERERHEREMELKITKLSYDIKIIYLRLFRPLLEILAINESTCKTCHTCRRGFLSQT